MSSRSKGIPETPLGPQETRILYNRFHGLKNKAANKQIFFAWSSFEQFAQDVLSKAPEGYKPSLYRMRFYFEKGGYSKETMKLSPGPSLRREENEKLPARSTVKKKAVNTPDWELMLELTVVLLTEGGTIQALVDKAMTNLDREVQSERENAE